MPRTTPSQRKRTSIRAQGFTSQLSEWPTPLLARFLVARECHLWCALGAPLMTGALMSARYDMEAAELNMGQLRERVQLMRENPAILVEVLPRSHAGQHSTGGVV